ncbi:MAG: hypothetical protein OEZ06_26365 [Myxococcales bacterium]|nr:hypothetical protein [Myxococcales bacterium]
MSHAEKLSVSLPADQVRWAKRAARSRKTSFSAFLSQLIEERRQHEHALEAFESYFGAKGRVTPEEAQELRREWKEE